MLSANSLILDQFRIYCLVQQYEEDNNNNNNPFARQQNYSLVKIESIYRQVTDLQAEMSFVTLTIHLCNGLNDKNLNELRKTCFMCNIIK